jgi:hypothetical protein
LDCEGCEYPIISQFKPFWQDHVQIVEGEMHHHYAPCDYNVFDALDVLCTGRAVERGAVRGNCTAGVGNRLRVKAPKRRHSCSRMCVYPTKLLGCASIQGKL